VISAPAHHIASAPAKLILCGEHAVVYGQPAIALPLPAVRARVGIEAAPVGTGIRLHTPDLGASWALHAQPDHPLSELVRATLHTLRHHSPDPRDPAPDLTITICSDIPIASGLGSGAAVASALVRALAGYLGHTLSTAQVSALVYQSEQRYHGTPSGIDNAVIASEQAIWFVRQQPAPLVEPLRLAAPLHLVVGDTGVRSETRLPVGALRARWQAAPAHYEALFDEVGALVAQARALLEQGDSRPDWRAALGALLNRNQDVLVQLGVSSPELERLVDAARAAGALGAKLSGGGWGGVMVALCEPARSEQVAAALHAAGATQVHGTRVGG
jgi:mevalonate kinase